jgi:acyl transferase domain-containing protein
MTVHSNELESIAIIGMSFRFPGASTLKQFWENLVGGVESISHFTEKQLLAAGVPAARLRDPNYVRARGILENIEFFDASLFGFTPREAEITDPQHRILLECAWEALEHAGYDSERYPGEIGVYAGMVGSSYMFNNLLPNQAVLASVGDFRIEIANDKDHLNTRISYKLNLKGPSVNINTACSTSLVAVHTACQSLLRYECDMALAGASYIRVPQIAGYYYTEGGTESPDGHCRTFDEKAGGAVGGNGVGLVVLKRLQEAIDDGDFIYAVIKGSCINNDGADRIGYTAPSMDGQARVIAGALALADVDPATIDYVETHGTATALGDSIEIAAVKQVFQQGRPRSVPCALGAVKTNVGHLGSTAGLAGLIKAVLALRHQTIPPTLHFQKPNPNLNLEQSPFYVNTQPRAWERRDHPRRAGVSSFGIGGTNAHVIVEEAPARLARPISRNWHLLLLSAKTESALEKHTANLAQHLRQEQDISLADVAYTLRMGRRILGHRRFVVASTPQSAADQLSNAKSGRSPGNHRETHDRCVAFMFPGEHGIAVNAGRGIYEVEPVFRSLVDYSAEFLHSYLRLDLRDVLYPRATDSEIASEKLRNPAVLHTAAFVVQYALAKLWMHWGINPETMLGDGVGEYVAASLANVLSFEDALRMVAIRGELIQSASTIDPIITPFIERLKRIKLSDPARPYISSVSGATLKPREASRPEYWARHLRSTLQLEAGFHQIGANPARLLLEVGAGDTMRKLAAKASPAILTAGSLSLPGKTINDEETLLHNLGTVWLEGVKIDWSHFRDDEQRLRVPLPTYPFERQRYWLDLPSRSELMENLKLLVASLPIPESGQQPEELPPSPAKPVVRPLPLYSRPPMMPDYVAPHNHLERTIAAMWSDILGIAEIGVNDRFFELGGDSLLANQILVRFASELRAHVTIQVFFQMPTIAELAEYIAASQIEGTDEQTLAAALEDIKNLSEEELQRLLAEEPETTIN